MGLSKEDDKGTGSLFVIVREIPWPAQSGYLLCYIASPIEEIYRSMWHSPRLIPILTSTSICSSSAPLNWVSSVMKIENLKIHFPHQVNEFQLSEAHQPISHAHMYCHPIDQPSWLFHVRLLKNSWKSFEWLHLGIPGKDLALWICQYVFRSWRICPSSSFGFFL